MDTARIAALLDPFLESPLQQSALEQISTYINLLQRWNARINLTAIRGEEEIVTRHFGESLFLARHLFPPPTKDRSVTSVLDIGSGAGFPALPLKIWAPEISLTLIESNHKKAAFLREVARALTLMSVNVLTARAETVTTTAEVVTLRAVEHFESTLQVAERLVSPKGCLALLISTAQLPLLKTMVWSQPIPIPNSRSRVLTTGVHPQ